MGDDMTDAMHVMLEMIAPVREGMKGFRAQLIADGWSETAAEQIAVALFIDMMHKPFSA